MGGHGGDVPHVGACLFTDGARHCQHVAGVVHYHKAGIGRIVEHLIGEGGVVTVLGLYLLLHLNVHRAVDGVAPVVQHIAGLGEGNSVEVSQVKGNIPYDHIHVPVLYLVCLGVVLGVTEDKLLRHGFVVLSFGDGGIFKQLAQHIFLTLLVCLRVCKGVEGVGAPGYGCKAGALRQIKLGYVLAEVFQRCCLYAGGGTAEAYAVKVCFQYLLLTAVLFKVIGTEHLTQLSVPGLAVVLCNVLDELLGDGGAAEASAPEQGAVQHLVDKGGECPEPVYTGVLVELLVLNVYKGILHVFGHLVKGYGDTVCRTGDGGELHLVAVLVVCIDKCGVGKVKGVKVNVDGGVFPELHDIHREGGGYDRHAYYHDEYEGEYDRADHHKSLLYGTCLLFLLLFLPGLGELSRFHSSIFPLRCLFISQGCCLLIGSSFL